MPRIEMQDPSGRTYVCDSSTPEIIARWMVETLPKVAGDPKYPGTVRVFPGFMWDFKTRTDVPDWPPAVNDLFQVFVKDGGVAGVRLLIKELTEYERRVGRG